MAKKRKASSSSSSSSQQSQEQKPKIVREEPVKEEKEEEEEEEESSSSSSEEEEESGEEESESEESSEEEEDEEEEESSSEDEPTDEASKRETLRELLEPFGKSQIIDLLKEAAAKDPKIVSKISQLADSDPTHRKIFVHGLGWDATSEQLLEAFRPFGEIEDSKLVTDKNTGRAKGYAFVLFKTRKATRKALKIPQKRIGSRMVSCQLAALGPPAGGGGGGGGVDGGGSRKIYVGNVGPHVSPEKLKAFFERFGEIEEGPSGMDLATNRFKGFAVVTFRTAEGYKKVLEEPIKVFENCQLHCKKFVENHNKNSGASQSAVGVGSASPAVTDVGYGGLGVGGGVLGSSLGAGGLMMASNPGVGLTGNALLAAGYNPAGLVASGLNTPVGGIGGNYGMSSISPSVMGSYGSQAALQGYGVYQNAQLGQSAVGTAATATTATRAPATGGVSASTTYASYYNR